MQGIEVVGCITQQLPAGPYPPVGVSFPNYSRPKYKYWWKPLLRPRQHPGEEKQNIRQQQQNYGFGQDSILVSITVSCTRRTQNMAEQPVPLLKFSAHHFRAEGVDEQAFAKWYQEEQIPRMIKLLTKHGITNYELVRIN